MSDMLARKPHCFALGFLALAVLAFLTLSAPSAHAGEPLAGDSNHPGLAKTRALAQKDPCFKWLYYAYWAWAFWDSQVDLAKSHGEDCSSFGKKYKEEIARIPPAQCGTLTNKQALSYEHYRDFLLHEGQKYFILLPLRTSFCDAPLTSVYLYLAEEQKSYIEAQCKPPFPPKPVDPELWKIRFQDCAKRPAPSPSPDPEVTIRPSPNPSASPSPAAEGFDPGFVPKEIEFPRRNPKPRGIKD